MTKNVYGMGEREYVFLKESVCVGGGGGGGRENVCWSV